MGLREVDRIHAVAKLLACRSSYGELMALHDGRTFEGIENPFILCMANFVLLFPIFLALVFIFDAGCRRDVKVISKPEDAGPIVGGWSAPMIDKLVT